MAHKPISYAHYAWAGGHSLVLAASLYCFFGVVTFSLKPRAYQLAYAGAIMSWGIVCYKSLGTPVLSRAYLSRALMDENVEYLVLALLWYLQGPIYLTLLPFATFSLFHTLTFVRTTLLPKPAPQNTQEGKPAPQSSSGSGLSKTLQIWIKNNYETAMLLVSFVELAVMARLVLGCLLFFTRFRSSFINPLVYAHFLRLRYYLSPQSRQAFATTNKYLEGWLNNPATPPQVKHVVLMGRNALIGFGSSLSIPQTPNPRQDGGSNGRRTAADGAQQS